MYDHRVPQAVVHLADAHLLFHRARAQIHYHVQVSFDQFDREHVLLHDRKENARNLFKGVALRCVAYTFVRVFVLTKLPFDELKTSKP